MMRQRQRKAVEELYGSKFDTPKSHVTVMQKHTAQRTQRIAERDNGYSSHASNNATILTNSPATVRKSCNSGKETTRRKSARGPSKYQNESSRCATETFATENVKRSAKTDKFASYEKEIGNEDVLQPTQHQHEQLHHQHRNHHKSNRAQVYHDEDNDDDTDEFFDLIRRTVESAIAKSMPELLNRKFRDLMSKVDGFSSELKNTNGLLNQLHKEIENKITHYGEQNSQHFRYLCMKSEYDKMFYQHQNLVAAGKAPTVDISKETIKPDKPKRSPKSSRSATKMKSKESDNTSKNGSCPCLGKSLSSTTPVSGLQPEPPAPSSDVSQKSSEFGMREVLEQIKMFCTQKQFNAVERVPSLEGPGTSHKRVIKNYIEVKQEAFEDDDNDEWDVSSDGMTPRNISKDKHYEYGGTTSRGASTHRGNSGAGDGQLQPV